MFENWDHLGARNYYYLSSAPNKFCRETKDILCETRTRIEVDPVSILSFMMKNYIIGDRTLVKGVLRSPWMAKPDGNGGWLYASLPQHGNMAAKAYDVAVCMREKLRKEALEFLADKKTVGILLSGGMDSRVVAGVIRDLQLSGCYGGNIVALTWGLRGARDLIYSQKIATRFGWDYLHFPISSETLRKNIYVAARRGAEFSPLHLHSMADVAEVKGVDGIIAASFGDSVGRGEYSGRKINKLPPILSSHFDRFGFLLTKVRVGARVDLEKDLDEYRNRFPRENELAYREMEMQAHYMRRQLSPCMEIISDKIPLCQMFTSPDVFGYMWSLDPGCRGDEIYWELLMLLPGNLLEIPWARTGVRYGCGEGNEKDNLTPFYHHYGKWLREDCFDMVKGLLEGGYLQNLGVFNERSLSVWTREFSKSKSLLADRIDERVAWLASLAVFAKEYSVGGINNCEVVRFVDAIETIKGYMYGRVYRVARRIVK